MRARRPRSQGKHLIWWGNAALYLICDTVRRDMNPIFRREFFARWRDRRSHLLLLALSLLLAIAAYRTYTDAVQIFDANYPSNHRGTTINSLATRASQAGRGLFTTLAVGNVGIWFVLAPLLLATGVARERERGLLELLQLSPMRPVAQVAARALSALSFLAVLQLVTLPIYFVAFSFGGVSESEIWAVWQIVAVTAFCGVGIGLALSAQSPRPSGALFGAVALLVVWSAVSVVGGNLVFWLRYLGLTGWVRPITESLYFSHPLVLILSIHSPNTLSGSFWTKLRPEAALPYSLGCWALVGVLGLLKATRDVTRAFPPPGWAGRNAFIEKRKKRHEERLRAQRERQARVSVEGALLADLPFDRLIRFKNPLLNREVKSRFRLRRASPWVWVGRTIIFLAGTGVWVLVMFSVFLDPPGRPNAVPMILWSEWVLGAALIATFSAASFAREREAGTWEGIQLSLVTPREITRTKWASPLVSYALLSCPLWLLLFMLVPIASWSGVPFRWIALGAFVVASSLCTVSALGSFVSLRAKSTASATCWTLGLLLSVWIGAPIVAQKLGVAEKVALHYYGLSAPLSRYSYESSENLALYRERTGIYIKNPGRYGSKGPTPAEQEQWRLYYEWFEQTIDGVQLFQTQFYFWNPIDVLTALQDRGKQTYSYSNYSYDSFTLNDNTVARMVFWHGVFYAIATLVLLLSVNVGLKKQRT